MPHLLVDISAHGFGHVSQTAPVVNALAQLIPSLRVSVRTAAPIAILRQRFQCDFTHIPAAFDFGMTMSNAVDVLVDESAANYLDFHAGWDAKVQREAQAMRALSPDLLLANIPYLSLAAARLANVRAVAMCSLSWAHIYHHYCVRDSASQDVYAQMSAAYNSAECFLQPQPSMPMPDLLNTRQINPIAKIGSKQRALMAMRQPSSATEKWVLLAMGGMEFRLPMEGWPRIQGVRWLVPAAWEIERADISSIESFGLAFGDVLASCDAVLSKPGYGTFVEAACAGVPVLYVARRDWPEEPQLVHWLKQHDASLEVERAALETGELHGILQRLWALPLPMRPVPSGANEAAHYLRDLMAGE